MEKSQCECFMTCASNLYCLFYLTNIGKNDRPPASLRCTKCAGEPKGEQEWREEEQETMIFSDQLYSILLHSLDFARLALCWPIFLGDANLLSNIRESSFFASSSAKCLEHTHVWVQSCCSSILSALIYLAFLSGSLGNRWKEPFRSFLKSRRCKYGLSWWKAALFSLSLSSLAHFTTIAKLVVCSFSLSTLK